MTTFIDQGLITHDLAGTVAIQIACIPCLTNSLLLAAATASSSKQSRSTVAKLINEFHVNALAELLIFIILLCYIYHERTYVTNPANLSMWMGLTIQLSKKKTKTSCTCLDLQAWAWPFT